MLGNKMLEREKLDLTTPESDALHSKMLDGELIDSRLLDTSLASSLLNTNFSVEPQLAPQRQSRGGCCNFFDSPVILTLSVVLFFVTGIPLAIEFYNTYSKPERKFTDRALCCEVIVKKRGSFHSSIP